MNSASHGILHLPMEQTRVQAKFLHSGRLAAEAAVSSLTGKVFPAENPVNVSRGSWQDLTVEDLVFQNGTGEIFQRIFRPGAVELESRKSNTAAFKRHNISPVLSLADILPLLAV